MEHYFNINDIEKYTSIFMNPSETIFSSKIEMERRNKAYLSMEWTVKTTTVIFKYPIYMT